MGIAARELSLYVIRPTLRYLGQNNPDAEALLLGIAASQSSLGSALHDRRGHGLYCIREASHAALWDRYLAQDPDLASAMLDARRRAPPLIQPEPVDGDGTRVLCLPGDAQHPLAERALPEPIPTRLIWRDKRFEPPQGFAPLLD